MWYQFYKQSKDFGRDVPLCLKSHPKCPWLSIDVDLSTKLVHVAIPFIGSLHKDLKISSWQLGLYDNFFVDTWGPRLHEVRTTPKTYHQFKAIGTVLQAPISDVMRPGEALYQVGLQLLYPTEAKEYWTDQPDIHDTYIECDFNQCRLSVITDKSSQMPLVRYIKDLWLPIALSTIDSNIFHLIHRRHHKPNDSHNFRNGMFHLFGIYYYVLFELQ